MRRGSAIVRKVRSRGRIPSKQDDKHRRNIRRASASLPLIWRESRSTARLTSILQERRPLLAARWSRHRCWCRCRLWNPGRPVSVHGAADGSSDRPYDRPCVPRLWSIREPYPFHERPDRLCERWPAAFLGPSMRSHDLLLPRSPPFAPVWTLACPSLGDERLTGRPCATTVPEPQRRIECRPVTREYGKRAEVEHKRTA